MNAGPLERSKEREREGDGTVTVSLTLVLLLLLFYICFNVFQCIDVVFVF